MQKDKAKEAANDGEVMKDRHGMCMFCHQVLNVRVPATWNDTLADEMATEICECSKSRQYTTRKSRIEKLDESMNIFFGPDSERDIMPDTVKIIRALAVEVIDGRVNKVTMELPAAHTEDLPEKLKISVKDIALKFEIEKKMKDITTI